MPYYSRDDEAVDDFDEYDPTPYGGGFDLFLTYGRPLSPSDDICHPHSLSAADDIDYERPQFDSYAQPSAYADDALQAEYSSYGRPKPRPGPAYGGDEYGGRPQPAFGFQPGVTKPGYGGSEYGSEVAGSEYGSGHGRKNEYGRPGSEYDSGNRRKTEYESAETEYGSGYGRRQESEEPGSEYGSGYGRKTEYQSQESEYGSGYGHGSGGGGYGGGRTEYESSGYRKNEYENPEEPPRRPSYGKQSYESQEGETYGRPSYGRSEEEDYRKPSYERRDDDEERRYGYGEEGYGRKKYGEDSDEEEKHGRHKHHHHHRKSYDDE